MCGYYVILFVYFILFLLYRFQVLLTKLELYCTCILFIYIFFENVRQNKRALAGVTLYQLASSVIHRHWEHRILLPVCHLILALIPPDLVLVTYSHHMHN